MKSVNCYVHEICGRPDVGRSVCLSRSFSSGKCFLCASKKSSNFINTAMKQQFFYFLVHRLQLNLRTSKIINVSLFSFNIPTTYRIESNNLVHFLNMYFLVIKKELKHTVEIVIFNLKKDVK